VANFIAIDLDSQGLYVVAGDARRSGLKITRAFPWSADTSADGDAPPTLTVETAPAIGEKLRDKLRAANIALAPIFVSIGRDRVILKEVKYPPVDPVEEPAVVRFQAMKEMTESPDDIVLDYAPLGDSDGERLAMVVVMRKDLFNAIQTLSQKLGQKLAGVTPRPYAVAAVVSRALAAGVVPPPAEPTEAIAALTLSPAGGEFTIVRGGEVTFTLAIPAPVVANETMLISQLRRNLAVYAGQHPGHPIQAVYLADGGEVWAERLRSALSVPVHAFDPLMEAAPEIPAALRGRFAGAVGLLAGRAADRLPINFAAPRKPEAPKDPAKKRLVVVATLALLLCGAVLAAGRYYVQGFQSQLTGLQAQRDELKSQITQTGPDAIRLKAIDAWTKREVNWLDELYELADRMPADDSVRLNMLTATAIQADKTGKQEAQANVEIRLAATDNTAATRLSDAFVRANPTANKYYAGTNINFSGPLPATSGNKHTYGATIRLKLNRREPEEYTLINRFTPAKTTSGATGLGSTVEPDTAVVVAPAPQEK
jgi:hypothetical protein